MTKPLPFRAHAFAVELYRYNVEIYVCRDCEKSWNEQLAAHFGRKGEKWDCYAYMVPKEDGVLGIILPVGADHSTVVHECFHAVYRIMRDRGITLTASSEETFAYLIGHIAQECWNFVSKYKPKKRK